MMPARSGSRRGGDRAGDTQAHLVTMNISGPSMERAQRIADYLLRLAPDAMVLTETRDNNGTRLLMSLLEAGGYAVQAPSAPHSRERGVAVATRRSTRTQVMTHDVTLSHRLLAVQVELPRPVLLVGVYVPSRDTSDAKIARKQLFLEQMTAAVGGFARTSDVVFMGDLNVVSRDHQPRYSAFRAWEYDVIDHLAGGDLVDAYSDLHPGDQAHSWIGRTGKGYRYDYAFTTSSLRDAVVACSYVHEPRMLGLTDHAAVHLHIAADVGAVAGHSAGRASELVSA